MPIYKVTNKKKDGLQKYQVKVNYTDKYGNRKQIMRTAYGSQAAKDLEKELLEVINNKDESSDLLNTGLTVQELYEEYISFIAHEIRASSVAKKKRMFKCHILPTMASVPIKNLDAQVLQQWKSYVYAKDLSLQSMKNCYKDFNAMLNYAVKFEHLTNNPLMKIGNFKNAYEGKKEMLFYTPDEFKTYKQSALQRAIESDYFDYYVFFCIAYYTGARKGEIHAMRWSNYTGKTISIEHSISQKIKGEDVETPPKNKSSIRVVQLPVPLIEILDEHKKRQRDRIAGWSEDAFICGYYRPLRDSSLDNENRANAKASGIKRIRIHDFRHSHASLLINGNISPLEVAHRLGHSTVEQTLSTYSHLFPSESEKSLNILNNI